MRILCDICHAYQDVVQVSPDYSPSDRDRFRSRAITLSFTFDGKVVDEYLLSPEFATRQSVFAGEHPLPQDYPAWIKLVKAICRPCFERG